MKIKSRFLWGLFILIACIGILDVITNAWQGGTNDPLTGLLRISLKQIPVWSLAAILLILHATRTLGAPRGFVFVLLTFVTGFVFEVIGVRYGTVFGGQYVYEVGTKFILLDIPLLIPLIWAGFIYAGYTIVSSYLFWVNKSKPSRHKDNLWLLLFLIVMDGLIVLFIDLIMEPLQVRAGNWIWLTMGSYFNIPVGNFVGWFAVTVTATGLFRSFEYLFPPSSERDNSSVLLIPVIGYGILCLALVGFSLINRTPILAIIGFLTMFPVTVINLRLYTVWKKNLMQLEMTV